MTQGRYYRIECRFLPGDRTDVRIVNPNHPDETIALTPRDSLRYVNHSPTGFAWGYGGSGPSQLAFAILLKLTGDPAAARANYMRFKWVGTAAGSWAEDLDITIDLDRFLAGDDTAVQTATVPR